MITTDSWLQQRAWVEIDRAALAHNLGQIKALLAPTTELLAVVKADAYGHGAIEVAKTLLAHGASGLAIATVPEGIELRQSGIDAPILLLGAAYSADQIAAIEKWQIQPTIVSADQADQFQQQLTQPIPVHLKLDTGMSRLGTNWTEAQKFCQAVQRHDKLQIASIYSHLATADDLDEQVMWQQQKRFQAATSQLQPLFATLPKRHLANSAGTLVDPSLHYDLVRPGLALYGLAPAPHLATKINLRPALSVRARITQVKAIAPGTGVSYGHRFVADRPMQIAIIGIGYADGVPRRLSQQLKVLLQGQWVHQIGTITMDQIVLDVTALPQVQVGEVVTLLGQVGDHQITADDWANILETISWEVLCGFKHRLPRLLC